MLARKRQDGVDEPNTEPLSHAVGGEPVADVECPSLGFGATNPSWDAEAAIADQIVAFSYAEVVLGQS